MPGWRPDILVELLQLACHGIPSSQPDDLAFDQAKISTDENKSRIDAAKCKWMNFTGSMVASPHISHDIHNERMT